MKIQFANVSLCLISYGSALCIGIQAETPLPESNKVSDKRASAELAKEAIQETANRFYNIGLCSGEAVETHERFSYVTVNERKMGKKVTLSPEESLIKGIEDMLFVQDQSVRRSAGWKPANKANIQEAARNIFQAIPREVSFLSRQTLRNQSNHSLPAVFVEA